MAENPEAENIKSMSDTERLVLCQKLDRELDDFINSLERKRYTEGWPEDRWEEEMDKHPFFMKSNPDGDEMSPLAEGLARLKYDPDENTPLELANNYKEDGNFNFKHKNYRLAILGYTEGIKVRCNDPEINASLYNNRAASHWYLKNYRSSLYDSEKALSFNPDHYKARVRAAMAATKLSKYETCIQHCRKLLEVHNNDKDIIELLDAAKEKKLIQERDARREMRKACKKEEEIDAIIKMIVERGIRISNCDDEDDIDLSKLEPTLPNSQDSVVHIENGVLNWPVLIMYPEYQMTDFVKACPENVPLLNQLEQLFPAPWDANNKYSTGTVNVYFEGYDKMPHVIDPKKDLGDLLVTKYFEVKAGTPAFFILPRGSVIETRFLESYL